MVHVVAIAVLVILTRVQPPGNQPAAPQPYKKLDQLIIDIKSDDPAANDCALTFLFQLATKEKCDELRNQKKEIVAALLRWLDDSEKSKNVLFILGTIGPEAKEAVPRITRFIKRPASDDRLALAAQLALRGIGENAAPAVPDLIDSFPRFYFGQIDNPQYRSALPLTLTAIAPKDSKVKDFLHKGLKDEEEAVRVYSALALWQQGSRAAELKEVWSKAQKDNDVGVRSDVGNIVARLARESPELLPLAFNALKDKESHVRFDTISALLEGKFTNHEVMDAFIERLSDSDEFVRASACEGLGKMGKKAEKAIPQLKKILQDKDLTVKVYAARALYRIDPTMARPALEILMEGLTHPSNYVRVEAAEGLKELGSSARPALPALRRALLDEWPDVSAKAAEAIKAIEK